MELPALSVDHGSARTVAVLRNPDGRILPLFFDGSVLLPSGRDDQPPADLEATLTRVRAEAERVAGQPPRSFVLTHPVSWGDGDRRVLADTATRAGLRLPILIPEPVAAAQAWPSARPGDRFVVVTLGARGFDVTLLRHNGTGFEVATTDSLSDRDGVDMGEQLGASVTAVTAAALNRAGVDPRALDGWLLVGDASRIAAVTPPLRRALGGEPTVVAQPELAVAEGGMAAAASLSLVTVEAAPPARRRRSGPTWTQVLDLDYRRERRGVVAQSLALLLPGLFGLFVAMDFFVFSPREDFMKAVVIVLVAGLLMVAGAARYQRAPDQAAEVTVSVTAEGITARNDAFEVTRDWGEIEAVGSSHDGRLAIRAAADELAVDGFQVPGIAFEGDLLLLGPIDPELWEDLATVVEFYAGNAFGADGVVAAP